MSGFLRSPWFAEIAAGTIVAGLSYPSFGFDEFKDRQANWESACREEI